MSARAATTENFAKAAKKIEDLSRAAKKYVPSGLRVIGEEIMTDCKASRPGAGVPVDKGTLRGTGRVDGPNSVGQVELSFGGPAAPYALIQHERDDYHHEVGESRYLIRAVDRWKAGGKSVAKAFRELRDAIAAIARNKAAASAAAAVAADEARMGPLADRFEDL